jgi:hypothetical protein
MNADSTIFLVLRPTRVVDRQSFTLATFDPSTGDIDGRISCACVGDHRRDVR